MAANVETELDIIHDTDENWEFYKILFKNNRKYFYFKNIYICSDKILNCFKADIIHMKFNTNNTNWWWLSKSMSDRALPLCIN